MPYETGSKTTQVIRQTTVPTITIAAKMSQGNRKLRRFFTAPQTNKADKIPPRISPSKEKTNTYVL